MRVRLYAAMVLSILATRCLAADHPTTMPLEKPDAEGFISLFNGKDLSGWDGLETHWSVKDGAITGSQTRESSKHTFLILGASKVEPAKFANFELRLKYRWQSDTGDSGIQIRSKIVPDPREPNPYKVGGYQVNTVPRRTYDGGFYDEAAVAGQRAIMAGRGFKTTWDAENKRTNEALPQSAQDLLASINQPNGEFNDMVIVANGRNFSITINGKLMGEMIDNSPKAVLDGGLIAFQLHSGQAMTIQFKDVKIKLLDAPKAP